MAETKDTAAAAAAAAAAPSKDHPPFDLDEILAVAQEAVLLAGREIRKVMRPESMSSSSTATTTLQSSSTTTFKSASTDLVTETDQACERLVIELLQSKYPTHCIIGEESSGADCQYELTDAPTWTIDPIDGTTNFVHKLSLTCVLIAFLVDQQPLVGVCYDPMADEMFYAVQGQGAFLQVGRGNGTSAGAAPQRISVSGTTDLTQAVIALDAGYGRSADVVDRYLAVQRAILLQRVRHVRVFGCCGLTMAYVACGRLDANLEEGSWDNNTGPKIWDFAPGKLIVQEAGGLTRDLTGRSIETTTSSTGLNLLQRSVFSASSTTLANDLLRTIYAPE